MPRPWILVLAGVNGAGKSSVGGDVLRRGAWEWFNPDAFARELRATVRCTPTEANAQAGQEGLRRLEQAIATGANHACETTLGGATIASTLRRAAASHDLMVWFCGLDSVERHIARVQARVARGGHDIPEEKIRERYTASGANLIVLMPHITRLQVHDNSVEAEIDKPMPNPRLLLQTENERIRVPADVPALFATPDWAKPILEAALSRTHPNGASSR